MQKLLSFTLTAFLALTAITFASDKDTIIQAEKDIWQIVKDKKANAFGQKLAADFRSVYSDGINTRDKEVALIKKIDVKSFSLGDTDVVMIDKDAALVTYTVTMEGTENGKDESGKYNTASVWKKDGNDWRLVFHSEVKIE